METFSDQFLFKNTFSVMNKERGGVKSRFYLHVIINHFSTASDALIKIRIEVQVDRIFI